MRYVRVKVVCNQVPHHEDVRKGGGTEPRLLNAGIR